MIFRVEWKCIIALSVIIQQTIMVEDIIVSFCCGKPKYLGTNFVEDLYAILLVSHFIFGYPFTSFLLQTFLFRRIGPASR